MLLRMLSKSCTVRTVTVLRAASTSVAAPSGMRQTAYVRYKPDADNLTISLVLGGRQRNLNRPVDEPLEKPITRIRANLAPAKPDKRAKKKKPNPADQQEQQQQQQELFIGLYKDAAATELIDLSTPNGQAWPAAAVLKVSSSSSSSSADGSSSSDQVFDIIVNPPTVETLTLPGFPMVGYPILPVVGLAFADPGFCRWRWLRKPYSGTRNNKVPKPNGNGPRSNGDLNPNGQNPAADEWADTGCYEMCYTPNEHDIGHTLRVECTPGAGGSSAPADAVYGEVLSADTGPVRAGPLQSAARIRQLSPGVLLPEPWRFRVMSYNILADQYAGTAYAQQVLFDYCPTELLDNNYRRQLVLEEVLRYQPDICCLQEVDDKVFSEYLKPHLERHGYAGHYANKQGKVREGSAMFWKSDKWAAAAVQDIKLRDVFKLPLSSRHAQFTPMLESSPALTEALQKVTTIAQMLLLLPRNAAAGSSAASPSAAAAAVAAPLLMINTHLFFHPYASHIRSLHVAAILEEAAAALSEWQQQAQQQQQHNDPAAAAAARTADHDLIRQLVDLPDPTVLFCGDLNSDLNSGVPGVIEMLQTGKLTADHWDWQMGATFRWGKEEGEYAEEEQQQQQQQQTTSPAAAVAATTQQQQQDPDPAAADAAATLQQQQQQQLPLEDGHDFEPGSSPRAAVAVHGIDVEIPFVLRSADDLATPYTNYTSGYKALLDYVWYDLTQVTCDSSATTTSSALYARLAAGTTFVCWYDPKQLHVTRQLSQAAEQLLSSFIPSASRHFEPQITNHRYDPKRLHVTRQLPQPAEQLLSTFIPSASFPSDHLAVVYDLAFKPPKTLDSAAAAAAAATAGAVSNPPEGLHPHDSATFTLLPATEDHITDAVTALQRDDVIALPTDTLYGFAAAAGSDAAVRQLRATKQRSDAAPFAVAVGDVADVALYCQVDQLPDGLLRALLPGPVTVLLPLKPDAKIAPAVVNPDAGGSSTAAGSSAAAGVVGIRVVPNEFVRGVCRGLGGGVALTSANLSGQESSVCIQDFRGLWQYCGAVFDSGPIPVTSNLGSTVVDLTQVAKQQQQQQQQRGDAGDGQHTANPAAAASAEAGGGFRIVRAGVAAESVIDLLTKNLGLKQL